MLSQAIFTPTLSLNLNISSLSSGISFGVSGWLKNLTQDSDIGGGWSERHGPLLLLE